MSMVGGAVVYVLKNARKLKYLKVISLVVFLRFFYTLLWKPLNSGFEPERGKFMVYARKALIHAGLLDTMVPQSYLDNLIETCPQITRNQVDRKVSWVRIPPLPPKPAWTLRLCGFLLAYLSFRIFSKWNIMLLFCRLFLRPLHKSSSTEYAYTDKYAGLHHARD